MGRLSGKTCLVTGAGQGIGRASAVAMAHEGARVIGTDINAFTLATLKDKRIEVHTLDVTDPNQIRQFVNQVNAPDVLFNCAGFVAHGSILDCEESNWIFSLNLNMTAIYRMIRAFLPSMIDAGGGSIINMSSVVSSTIAAPNRFAYGATKAGVIGMTKSVAADYISQGIRCNAICPGTVESPSLESRLRAQGDYQKARANFVARQPIGRIGRAEEIAALVVHLASDESAYTTGGIHVIDGGWSNV